MIRLTKKNNGTGSWTQTGDKYIPNHNIRHKQCVNKLGELEDIEEKLGIELQILFKAIENGIFYLDMDKRIVFMPYINIDFREKEYLFSHISDVLISVRDYGKTWALTYKELEGQENE